MRARRARVACSEHHSTWLNLFATLKRSGQTCTADREQTHTAATAYMSSRMSFEPSSLLADERYGQHTSPMELGLYRRLQAVADEPQQLRSMAMKLLDVLKDECGGGTAMVMVSCFAAAPECEVRYNEPGSKDGLACAVWFELGLEDDDSKQTAFIRHVRLNPFVHSPPYWPTKTRGGAPGLLVW